MMLQGKVIAITGAASGIGRATALACAAKGALLALADVSAKPLEELVSELKAHNVKVIGTNVDVSNSESVDAWIANVITEFGRLDGAANIAGVENKGPSGGGVVTDIVDTSDEGWNFILGVNLTGMFYCLRAELRVMTNGASIVNVSSIAGMKGRPGLAAYSSSKHGVVGLTKSAAREVGKKGIRVNAVAPGPIDTPMLQRILSDGSEKAEALTNTYKTLPLGRLGASEDIARAICFLLSDESTWTTGVIFPVDGGVMC